MANTFNRTQAAKEQFNTVGNKIKSASPFYSWHVEEARALVGKRAEELAVQQLAVQNLLDNGAVVDTATREAYENAARAYNMSVKGMRYATHDVVAIVEGMFKNMAETIGVNTENWGSAKVSMKDIKAHAEDVKALERTQFKRFISKPVRILAENPVLAILGIGAATVVGAGEALHKQAERKTEEAAMREAIAIEARHNQPQMPLAQASTFVLPPAQAPAPAQPQAPVPIVQQTTVLPAPAAPAPAPVAQNPEIQFPAAGTAMNPASSQLMAGNDNVQYHGTVATERQQAAAL